MNVTVVRIYVTEGGGMHERLFRLLHDEERVRGVTIFRGIAGFGTSGKIQSSSLLDLSLDLPVVVEFFDTPERVAEVLARIDGMVSPGHVLTFAAESH